MFVSLWMFYGVEGFEIVTVFTQKTFVTLHYGKKKSIPDVLVLAISYFCVSKRWNLIFVMLDCSMWEVVCFVIKNWKL